MSPLFGVVLSEVPAAVAGRGSGVLTTTQQTALALGVATLGSLFLALAADGTSISTAFIIVLAVQVVVRSASPPERAGCWRRRAPALLPRRGGRRARMAATPGPAEPTESRSAGLRARLPVLAGATVKPQMSDK